MVFTISPNIPSHLPIASACLRNQQPIADVLTNLFAEVNHVIEIGSGTGQHAVYCAASLPHLVWQPTELAEATQAIERWRAYASLSNVAKPVILDVNECPWPEFAQSFDGVFTANTLHYVSWKTVEALFTGLAEKTSGDAIAAIYGPFNEQGRYTSEGNRNLDCWLKERDPQSGIKDLEAVMRIAKHHGWRLTETVRMPANNLLLALKRNNRNL